MRIAYVYGTIKHSFNIPEEQMEQAATFIMFDNQLHVTVQNLDFRSFPVEKDNSEKNGYTLILYIHTRGKLFQDGNFVRKEKFIKKGRTYRR